MNLVGLLFVLVVAILSTVFGCADGVMSPVCDFLAGVEAPMSG